jgi:hypothetical protein
MFRVIPRKGGGRGVFSCFTRDCERFTPSRDLNA